MPFQYKWHFVDQLKKHVLFVTILYSRFFLLFKNMSDLREQPKVFDEKEFDRLFEMAELCNFTPDEYYNYQNSQETARNLLSIGLSVEQIMNVESII